MRGDETTSAWDRLRRRRTPATLRHAPELNRPAPADPDLDCWCRPCGRARMWQRQHHRDAEPRDRSDPHERDDLRRGQRQDHRGPPPGALGGRCHLRERQHGHRHHTHQWLGHRRRPREHEHRRDVRRRHEADDAVLAVRDALREPINRRDSPRVLSAVPNGGVMRFSLVLMLSLLHPGSRAVAQRTAPPACTETAVRDSSHIWREVDAQYARLADAMRRKDVDALFALYTPDYRVVMGNGEIWSRERSLEYQRAGLARVRETHHISNTIIRLTACGDHATATVLQQWYRTQDMAGAARRVETNAVQDEHWVRTAGGWKRGDIGEISRGASFVDGKRVDITKPYDPDAPPYDPSAASSPR